MEMPNSSRKGSVKGDNDIAAYQLIHKGKIIVESPRKIDVIYEHQSYNRKQNVRYAEVKKRRVTKAAAKPPTLTKTPKPPKSKAKGAPNV